MPFFLFNRYAFCLPLLKSTLIIIASEDVRFFKGRAKIFIVYSISIVFDVNRESPGSFQIKKQGIFIIQEAVLFFSLR